MANQNAALMEALKGLKHIVELAVTNPDGTQYAYLETRNKSFVHVVDALKKADAALASPAPQAEEAERRRFQKLDFDYADKDNVRTFHATAFDAGVNSALAARADLVKQVEELKEKVLEFDTWLNAPPSREVQEPEEARLYRFDAYKRWEKVAVAAMKISKEQTK